MRFLLSNGDVVAADTPYAEIEVMKMYLHLKTQISGMIKLIAVEGIYYTQLN